jgi:hypothetical protein
MKSVGDFAMGHAGTLVEIDDGGLGVGAELALGGAGGVGRLQFVSATQMLAALAAAAAVDGEFADDGLSRNVGLKLLVEMILDDIAAAIGTLFGQGGSESFIDALGGRRLTMGVQAVLFAFLAARLFGTLLGFAFGERGGLALGGAFEFFNTFLQVADDLLLARILFAEVLNFEEKPIVGRRVHANLGSDEPCQLYEIIAIL